jgi:hypothetical protein
MWDKILSFIIGKGGGEDVRILLTVAFFFNKN